MSKFTINVPMSVNGFKEYKNIITFMVKNANRMQEYFLKYSLEYIKKQANIHLQETYHDSDWYFRTGLLESSWTENVDAISGILKNVAPYSAFVEYGTGLIGKHPLADLHGYKYNVNQHDKKGWGFKPNVEFPNLEQYEEYHFTQGNEGYWYLYRAIVDDYLHSNMAQYNFDRAFTKVMHNKIK